MNEEIDNDPDFEENSIDPFNSDESIKTKSISKIII